MFSLVTREEHSPNRWREVLCEFSFGTIGGDVWPLGVCWFLLPIQSAPVNSPDQASGVGGVGSSFKTCVNNVVIAKLSLLLAAFCVLKAALNGAEGHNPLGSIIAAFFLLSGQVTVWLMRGWNHGQSLRLRTCGHRCGTSWQARYSLRKQVWQVRMPSSITHGSGHSGIFWASLPSIPGV
jgi:hypothetical protein